MRTKKEATTMLSEMREAAEQTRTYDYVADLEQLRKQLDRMTAAQFRKALAALIDKYRSWEGADVHAALVAKAKAGDVDAIKLYNEQMAATGAAEGGVTIVDDL